MISEARLDWHFDNWRRYMRRDSVTDGYPRKSSGFVGGGYSASFEDMVDHADIRCAITVDAVVGSLPEDQKWAVHSEYLGAKIRVGYEEFKLALELARRYVAKALFDRGVI